MAALPFALHSSGPAPSPSSFLPSPSPQPSQSPVTARTPQNFSVPSPGPLNTPGKSDPRRAQSGALRGEGLTTLRGLGPCSLGRVPQ